VAPFTTPAALAGKHLHLLAAEALAKGPVVVYFFPRRFRWAARSRRMLADAMEQFAA
jgi:hypothetical protein